MRKKRLFVFVFLMIVVLCLCGCAKKCANCGNKIEKGKEIQIEDNFYDETCVEYCQGCNTPTVKDSGALLTYKDNRYCKDCFAKEAYPIVLEDNDHIAVSITGYDDETGMFAVKIENKSEHEISSYQEGESALMDGSTQCTPETDGTHSFAYATIPAKQDLTVFSSFRAGTGDADKWDEIYKMSEGHAFEFAMHAYTTDTEGDDFWDTTYKVKLTPDMFGYVK